MPAVGPTLIEQCIRAAIKEGFEMVEMLLCRALRIRGDVLIMAAASRDFHNFNVRFPRRSTASAAQNPRPDHAKTMSCSARRASRCVPHEAVGQL